MELKDFILKVLTENEIEGNVDEIETLITDIARERASDSMCVAISDDEVREMIINNAELSNKLVQEKEAKKLKEEQEKKYKEEMQKAEKLQKQIDKERRIGTNAEQQSLF